MRRRAELVFIESPRGGHWHGRLLNEEHAVDQETGRRARYVARIDEVPGGVQTTMQGHHRGGRRYSMFYATDDYDRLVGRERPDPLTAAQTALRAWARRRFYYEEEA